MSPATPAAIERFLTARDFWRGAALKATLCFAVAAILLTVQVLNLFLVVDLLHHAGRLEIRPDQLESFTNLVPDYGSYESLQPVARMAAEIEAGETDAAAAELTDTGILPAVWWARKTAVWHVPLAWLYRTFNTLKSNAQAFLALVIVTVVVGLIRSLAVTRGQRLSSAVGLEIGTRIRQGIHRQCLRLGPSDVEDSARDDVLELFTRHVDRIINGLDQWIQRRAHDWLAIVLLVATCISLHWRVALQCLIPSAFCWYLIRRLQQRNDQAAGLISDRANHELRLLSESLHKSRLVRGYGMEDFEQQQFELHAKRFRDNLRHIMRQGNWTARAERLAIVVCVSVVLYLLGIKVLVDADAPAALSLAAMVAMVAAIGMLLGPIQRLVELRAVQDDVNEAASRITRYMNQIPEVGQAVGARFLQPLARTLHFENIHYSLSRNGDLLKGLDLKITAGEVVAVVSLNTLESRALAYMLPRFVEPRQGRVLIDGEDIAWVTLESLRAETVYVGSSDPLFTGTVLENIRCGQTNYSLNDATEAAKTAHAHNFILRLPEGYETLLGEHGEQLEAGAAFRLGLARAVLRDPALLIIDEPSEQLDEDTKSLIDDAYNRIFPERTVLILPSRLSTLKRANRIIVLNQGRVEAIGKHQDLVKSCDLYRHWEYIHFNVYARPVMADA